MSRVRLPPCAALAAALAVAGCTALPVAQHSPYHPSDADLAVTRIVHATVLVEMHGTRLLVDPWFHSGLVFGQREPLGLTPDALPSLAAVLLTHGHSDHFDERVLRELAATVPIAVGPADLRGRLERLGFRQVVVLGWWDHAEIGDVVVTAVPTRHGAPENGYVLEAHGVRAYLAGDTRWFPELVDVATRFPKPDVALLPIGGSRVLGVLREMNPAEAARAAELLEPRRIIPIHYGETGGFPLRWHSRHPIESFIDECGERGIAKDRIVVLAPGESWHSFR